MCVAVLIGGRSSSGSIPEPAARVLASDHVPDCRVNLISNISAADRLPAVPELVPRPSAGRVFTGARRVRLADVSPAGRLRLDAAARFLQDLSADDTADAALPDAEAWVVRKTVIQVVAFPRYLEPLELATWCSGTGSHWAERRISIAGERGGAIEAATTWVHIDMASGRPSRIPAGFDELYGEAHEGRKVKARLDHPDPPPDGDLDGFPWPLRFSDFDVLGHVNNAACWQIVEEALAQHRDLRAPLVAEVQHRTAIERGAEVEVTVGAEGGDLALWVAADQVLAVTARVTAADG
jgi:acyl-ACP thioesterase